MTPILVAANDDDDFHRQLTAILPRLRAYARLLLDTEDAISAEAALRTNRMHRSPGEEPARVG